MLMCIDIVTVSLYFDSVVWLITERWRTPVEKRPELITAQLLFAVTFCFVSIIWKTHSLVAMCVSG